MTRPSRISEFYDAEVCLSGDQGDLDITARFTIEGEYYGGRDKCVAIDTEFLSAQWGGLIITRGSVTLEETSQIKVHLHDGRRVTAEIVREDRDTKMVLLRILGGTKDVFPAATLGDSDKVRTGDFVMLVGNAYKVARGRERCA